MKFNPKYNIIGDYDFIIRASKKFKGMSFQDKLVNIRIHRTNFSHSNRKMFYLEFKDWINKQNFKKQNFKKNKFYLDQKLEYLRLISLLTSNKRFNLIFDIIKIDNFVLKIKLLIIFMIPSFVIDIKLKYF